MGAELGLQFAADNTARPVQNRKKEMLKWLDARNSGAPGSIALSSAKTSRCRPSMAICQAYCKKQKTSDESFGCVGLWTKITGEVQEVGNARGAPAERLKDPQYPYQLELHRKASMVEGCNCPPKHSSLPGKRT